MLFRSFGHRLGNRALAGIVRWIFGRGASDLLSGYRVFSRRFVKSFPALARGFEIEAEFTIHALALHMPMRELRTAYRERPPGSASKLGTIRDGVRILRAILELTARERSLQTAALIAAVLLVGGLLLRELAKLGIGLRAGHLLDLGELLEDGLVGAIALDHRADLLGFPGEALVGGGVLDDHREIGRAHV